MYLLSLTPGQKGFLIDVVLTVRLSSVCVKWQKGSVIPHVLMNSQNKPHTEFIGEAAHCLGLLRLFTDLKQEV